jgi:radical SAM superfamily enzyme with C-terminal helix-hairpin-helix motif
MKRYLILDCYVDEPACLGVPPFISPYPRYIYGALLASGVDPENIYYETIDILRDREYWLGREYEAVFLIGGAVVPGKYLGAEIGTLREIERILLRNSEQFFIAGGHASELIGNSHKNVMAVKNDIDKFAAGFVKSNRADLCRTTAETAVWSILGAGVVKMSPFYPHIICEIETYRGCPREKHCSFCVEGQSGEPEFREVEDILAEVDKLIAHGVTRFRIGRQADILQFRSTLSRYRNGFPEPDPAPLVLLFGELKKRRDTGLISVLNIDNGNPGTLANFPHQSAKILEAIAGAVTPGDTLALGIESFDPEVVRRNNLKVNSSEALAAVRLVNETGGRREEGIPVLLPGINLIHGLAGETDETFRTNYEKLLEIRDAGLLVKRINIRKLLPHPGTPLGENTPVMNRRTVNRFEYYRERIRKEIDNHMLKEIYPRGTLIKDVQVLDNYAGYSYGKQIASYSIAARFPVDLELRSFTDSVVTGHRERSLDVLPWPFNINSLPDRAISSIPGISKKTASEIVLRRPFASLDEFRSFLEEKDVTVDEDILIAMRTGE